MFNATKYFKFFVVFPFSLYRVFSVSSFFIDTCIFIDCELRTKTLSFMIIAVTPLLLLEATLRHLHGFSHTTMCWLVFVPEAV